MMRSEDPGATVLGAAPLRAYGLKGQSEVALADLRPTELAALGQVEGVKFAGLMLARVPSGELPESRDLLSGTNRIGTLSARRNRDGNCHAAARAVEMIHVCDSSMTLSPLSPTGKTVTRPRNCHDRFVTGLGGKTAGRDRCDSFSDLPLVTGDSLVGIVFYNAHIHAQGPPTGKKRSPVTRGASWR